MKRTKLVAARARKCWTLAQAAERIGCTPNTLSRWELGGMAPSSYNKERLCAVYGMTTEELGLEEEAIRLTDLPAMTGDLQVFLNADLTMRLLALVFTPHGNPLRLQAVLSRILEEFTMDTGHEAALTRREALRRLAMLPVLFGISAGVQRPLEDTLNQCAAGITACEHLSKGNHEDMALAYSMVSLYLQVLKPIVKESSLYRKEAAALITQCYLLLHVLGLQIDGPGVAMRYAKLAVVSSKESGDLSLQVTALRRLTWEYLEDKQPGQALKTIEHARYLIENSHRPVPTRIRSSIYGTLAVTQAKNGIDAIPALYLAQESFFAPSDASDENSFANFIYAQLMRNEGLAHSYQGRYKQALDSYSQVIDPEKLSPKVVMPIRTHAELLYCQTIATLKSPARDMERVIALWKADIQSALTLRSQQRFEEACMAYEVMEGVWPNERRVMELRDLIVHW
jgi:transcriptional regulator with XRE-family HTH domain/tetratricopeptide (TPR) repeat protein